MREDAQEFRVGDVADVNLLAGREGNQARDGAGATCSIQLVLHLGDQGGDHLPALDPAPDHLAVVAAGDDAIAAGVDRRRENRTAPQSAHLGAAMGLYRDESLRRLEADGAVAQGEHGAARAVEQGVGDEGVKRKDHARAIRHESPDDRPRKPAPRLISRQARAVPRKLPFERVRPKRLEKGVAIAPRPRALLPRSSAPDVAI
jgi:hypothetical protein